MATKKRSTRASRKQRRRPGSPARRSDARHRRPPAKPQAARSRASDDLEQERRAILEEIRELCRSMDAALAAREPAEFLLTAAGMYATDTDDPGTNPSDLTRLLEAYAYGVDRSVMATAYVLSRMVGTHGDRAMVDELLGPAIGLFPDWIQLLDRARPTTAWLGVDELRSQATYTIGLRLAVDDPLILTGVVDLGRGGELVDVLVGSRSPDQAEMTWRKHVVDGELQAIAPTDARAELEAATRRGASSASKDPVVWTARRVVLDWALAMLPADGTPIPRLGLPPWGRVQASCETDRIGG